MHLRGSLQEQIMLCFDGLKEEGWKFTYTGPRFFCLIIWVSFDYPCNVAPRLIPFNLCPVSLQLLWGPVPRSFHPIIWVSFGYPCNLAPRLIQFNLYPVSLQLRPRLLTFYTRLRLPAIWSSKLWHWHADSVPMSRSGLKIWTFCQKRKVRKQPLGAPFHYANLGVWLH